MREVSIQQLWNRAWDLFKVNWLLLLGLVVPSIIVSLISFTGALIVGILLFPVLVRAGYLVARQGQSSFREAFGDISLLLKVLVYYLIMELIPGILIVFMDMPVLGSATPRLFEASMEGDYGGVSGSMALSGTGVILLWLGYILILILNLFGWAGPYAILSGRAGIFSAIGQSFSLTAQNFGKVFVAFLLFIGLAILGLLLCGVGLLVVVPMSYVFWPLLYLALTGEEGVPHA
jgi:uncharacterized membrane protein